MTLRIRRRALLTALVSTAAAPAYAADGAPDFLELPVEGMERAGSNVWVRELAPSVWITCFTFDSRDERWGWIPCNGLIVAASDGAVIVDTGNSHRQGAALLEIAERVTGRQVVSAIATHFHNDRVGGLRAMNSAGVPVFAHPFSVGLAQAYRQLVPEPVAGLEKGAVTLGDIELFFPGPGHSRDNITVWHAESGVLFGGCLLRATTDRGIGALADADVDAYPATIARLIERYPERRFVVPGHGSIAGDALTWTRDILAAQQSN